MVDERAALSLPGPPAAATTAAIGTMAPPPPPTSSPRPPPISVPPLPLSSPPGKAVTDPSAAPNGNGHSEGGGIHLHARTLDQEDVDAPQPSPRTKRFTPVRALHVGTGTPPAVPEGVVLMGAPARTPSFASTSSFPNPPRVGSHTGASAEGGVTVQAQPQPTTGPSSLAAPSPAHHIARRMSNVDRRVRSEALPAQKRHMSIASSRRPSILTGGYESSTDDDSKDRSAPGLRGPTLLNAGSAHASSHSHLAAPSTTVRRRAQSLLATPGESWPHSPSTLTPPGTSRRSSRLVRPTGSPLRTPAGSGIPSASLSRAASDVLTQQQAQSRSGRSGSGGGRPREPSVSVADNNDRENQQQQQRMVEQRRNHPLAASLGLGTSRPAILSPDQIEQLLADTDVNSAMARMAKPMRRQTSLTSNDPPPQQSPSATSSSTFTSSTLPTSNTSVPTSPPLSRPYLATAPPALTNGEWQGRERGISVSSSIATSTAAGTPLRNVTPYNNATRRPRALSVATSENSDGGHIPFTHHVPPVLLEDSDIEEHPVDKAEEMDKEPSRHGVDRTATATPNNGGDQTPIPINDPKDDRAKEKKARHRISGLFGLRSRKRDMSPPPPATLPHMHAAALAQTAQPKKRAAAPERPRDREAEMRRAEQERREEEAAQELRYRSVMQIHAHPASQRRAQRAAVHLDGYYSLIYQGLDNPPKLNPLAVLRWVKRTDEQKEMRAKWMREHADSSRLASPLPWPGARSSPSSPSSDALRSISPRYMASPRPLPAHSIGGSVASKEAGVAPGWHYSLDDVQGYNESGGRVDFFIPPVLAPEPPETVDPIERERPQSISVHSEAHASLPSVESGPDWERERQASALATRITSPSTPSLVQSAENGEGDGSAGGLLSRRASADTGKAGPSGHRPIQHRVYRHRSHQSTSGIPQSSKPLQTLRALSTGVKRNLALAVHSPATDNEDERHGGSAAPSWHQPASINGSPHNPHHVTSTHSLRDGRGLLGLRRAHAAQDGMATSDDEHHHLRRLLTKGRGVAMDRLSRRVTGPSALGERGVSRADELRNLEQALARERTLREAQAKKAKRTELELQAEERIREVEDEIYAERVQRLHDAQKRLTDAEVEENQMDSAITHYLGQLDQVRSVFRTAADVEVKFENLDELSRPAKRDTDDEEADRLGPLLAESDVNFSDRNKRPDMRSSRAPRQPTRQASNISSPTHPSFAYGLQAWPKRSTVDPTLGIPLDPFRRVELSCEKAHATVRDMDEQRAAATRQMQEMVTGVNQLIMQKDNVRAWAKGANERIVGLKATKANKATKIHGGLFASMWNGPGIDIVTDMFVRSCLAVFSYGIRMGRVVSWVRGRGWLAWALLGGVLSMLVFFYLAGSGEMPALPTVVSAGASPLATA